MVTVYSFIITVEFFLLFKPQFTKNAHNFLYLNQCTRKHLCSWTVAPFQRFWGCFDWLDRHANYNGAVCLHFRLELNTMRGSKCPHRQSIKDWGRANVWVLPRKLCVHIVIWTSCFGVGNSCSLSKIFIYAIEMVSGLGWQECSKRCAFIK
jgi:hypothetical protein